PNAQLYDSASGVFLPTGDMTTDRHDYTATPERRRRTNERLRPPRRQWTRSEYLHVLCAPASAELYHPAAVAPVPVFSLSSGRQGRGAILHAEVVEREAALKGGCSQA